MEIWEAQMWYPLLFLQSQSAGYSKECLKHTRQALSQMWHMARILKFSLSYNTWSRNVLIGDIECREAYMPRQNNVKGIPSTPVQKNPV